VIRLAGLDNRPSCQNRNGCPASGKDRRSCQPIRPNQALALIVEVLAYGGLRIGEALALRRRHVDVLGCKLVVAESLTEVDGQFSFGSTKAHQGREVPLPRSLLADLERHLDAAVGMTTDALLFTSTTGGPVRYRSLRRSFDAACRRVGLVDVTPHSLRASCASWVAESDGVLEAARRLGTAAPASRPGTTRDRLPAATPSSPTASTRRDKPPAQVQRRRQRHLIWHVSGTTVESHPWKTGVGERRTLSDLRRCTTRGGSSAG